MPNDPPRLGPWLRQTPRDETPPRERLREYLVAGSAALGGLAVLGVVLVAFIRYPFPTLAVLVAVWGTGYAVYRIKKGRADLRDRLLKQKLDDDYRR